MARIRRFGTVPEDGTVPKGYRANPQRYHEYRNDTGGKSFQRAWPARGVPDRAFLTVEMLNNIEDYIRDFGTVRRNLQYGMNALVQILARGHQGHAQEMSRGPNDPRNARPEMAWRKPVRRITSRYYQGWRVRRLRPGVWQSFNDTREAYYIEYGIHPSARRVRRPINKLALIKTLRWADNSRVGHRVWEMTYGPLRKRPYTGRGQLLSGTNVQSPGVMRHL